MATNDILIGFCLDQSGSMGTPYADPEETKKGFNKFLEEQASQPGNAWITLVLFDTASTVRFTAGDIKLVDKLGERSNPYTPSGGTALYDAVADTIRAHDDWLAAQNPPFDGHVLLAVLTDGDENSSTHTTIEQLNDLIRDRKENGNWGVVFLGSGGSSWTEGKKFEAMGTANLHYAGAAVRGSTMSTYNTLSSSVSHSRASGQHLNSSFSSAAAASGLNADPTMAQASAPEAGNPFVNVPFTDDEGDEEDSE